MSDLSAEDSLRLNVLLASKPQAIRIDESSMTVCGLTERGEAKVRLNPTCRDERYLRYVRELISGHVLGSPGGYPVYLKRWTRMGQARDESLEQLLLLGEPEAVVAVVHANGLTNELARRAWWAMPTAENARRMLERRSVADGGIGPVLAEFLVEFLPFEEEPLAVIESVRLVLQPGLVDGQTRLDLWKRGRNKNAYHVGFLAATPEDLPEPEPPRDDAEALLPRIEPLAAAGNPYARQLLRVLSGAGQSFLRTAGQVMKRPGSQDLVNVLFDVIARYFSEVRPDADPEAELDVLIRDAESWIYGQSGSCPAGLAELVGAVPELRPELRALLILSRLGYPVVRPVFSHTTAIGSLMRRKLEPITTPLLREIACLRGSPDWH